VRLAGLGPPRLRFWQVPSELQRTRRPDDDGVRHLLFLGGSQRSILAWRGSNERLHSAGVAGSFFA